MFAKMRVKSKNCSSASQEIALFSMIVLAGFLTLYNVAAINVAIPEFLSHFRASITTVQWIGIAYTLVMGVVSPLSAYLTRYFTLRHYFIFSMAAYAFFSLLSGYANSIYMVIIVRAFQGLAGVALVPATMMVIFRFVPRNRQALYLTIQSMSISLGPSIGPLIAGALISYFSWRWIFWLNIPLGILAVFCACYSIPKEKPEREEKVDFLSFVLVALGCFPMLLAFSLSISWGLLSWKIVLMLIFGSIFLYLFIYRQFHLEHPILDLSVLKYKSYRNTVIINGILSMALCLGPFVLSIYFQTVQKYSAMTYGLLLLVPAFFSIFGAPFAQKLYHFLSARTLILAGLWCMIIGSFFLSFLSVNTALWYVLGSLCLRYLGIGILGMPLNDHGMSSLPKEKMDDGATFINWLKLIITSFSLAIFTLMYESSEKFFAQKIALLEATTNAINIVFMVSGVCCFIGIFFAIGLNKKSIHS